MKVQRAIEILDPTHREHYDDLAVVEEACKMGVEALKKELPHIADIAVYGQDGLDITCPKCGTDLLAHIEVEELYEEIKYCPCCGVHIVFEEKTEQEELGYE